MFSAAHDLVEFVPESGLRDVAAGFGQAYFFQAGNILRLEAGRLQWVANGGQVPNANPGWGSIQSQTGSLALRRPGEIVVALRDCWFNGALVVDTNDAPPSRSPLATSDLEALRGPTYPRRIAVGDDDVWVMQGGYMEEGGLSLPRVFPLSAAFGTVQRWSRDGALLDQHNYCDPAQVTDVSVDGADLYVATAHTLDVRGAALPPDWLAYQSGGDLRAADAGDRQVAVLDETRREAIVYDRAGTVLGRRSYALPLTAIPVDVAMSRGRIWLADAGAQQLVGVPLVGSSIARIAVPDAPRALADGPDGTLFVLGSRAWIYRYAPDGKMLAAWRLPIDDVLSERGAEHGRDTLDASDIAVGPDGRVFVPYTVIGGYDHERVVQAGIWVFAPAAAAPGEGSAPTPAPAPPSRSACLAAADKRAAPNRVLVGQSVTVTLRIDGRCPGAAEPHQVVFVVDTSGSMTPLALYKARAAVIALLEAMNATIGEAALVRFSDNGIIAAPLTNRLADVRAAVLQLSARGATHFVAGIEAAQRELTGPHGHAGTRRTIVLVTDGIPDDDPGPALEAARAAGLNVVALIYPTRTARADLEPVLAPLLAGGPLYFDLRADEVGPVVDDLRRWRELPGLFDRVDVVDEIPADMRLDPASVDPPAALSGATLTWTLGAVAAADGVTLRYRLVPQSSGHRPTNVRAAADYRDVSGYAGRLVFPIPYIDVLAPPTPSPSPTLPSPTPTRSPSATSAPPTHTATATPTTTPAPTATPTSTARSGRTIIHLPILIREAIVHHARRTDIVLIIDTSGSMAGDKLAAAKAAAGTFIDLLPVPDNRVGLVSFNQDVVDALPPTEDVVSVRRRIDALTTAPGTRIDRALSMAKALLAAFGPSSNRAPVVVLLTDGRQAEEPATASAAAAALRDAGVEIWAIGLGGDVDAAYLAELTAAPGRIRLAPRPSDLDEVYAAIARVLPCRPSDYWGRRCG